MKNFAKWLREQEEKTNRFNVFAPPLKAQDAMSFLIDYLLGDDWYVMYPARTEQINAEAVDAILLKYSKKYRKDIKKERKDARRKLGENRSRS